MNGIPIIELKVRSMEHAIASALSDYEVKISKEVQERVKEFLKPDNLKRVVAIEVDRVVEACIKDAIKDYYSYSGEGRKIIRAAINAKLDQMAKDIF